jgi:hypothetical protein
MMSDSVVSEWRAFGCKRVRSSLRIGFGPYLGYTTGKRWNGWATPYFDYDVAQQMVEDWKGDAMKIDVGSGLEAYWGCNHVSAAHIICTAP